MEAPEFIYKILLLPEYEAMKQSKAWLGTPIDLRDGFIHLSTAKQSVQVADRFFSTELHLVLLQVPTRFYSESQLKWENAVSPQPNLGKAEFEAASSFPHLYCPLSSYSNVFHVDRESILVPFGCVWPICWFNDSEYRFSIVATFQDFLGVCEASYDVPQQLFADHWLLDPFITPNDFLLCYDKSGVAVGAMRRYNRVLACANVSIAGLGDVCVLPNHRNKGIASKMIELGDKLLFGGDTADLALLHTTGESTAHRIYTRNGWSQFRVDFSTAYLMHWSQPFIEDAQKIMTYQLHDDDPAIASIQAVYSKHTHPFGPFERSIEYWQNWVFRRTDPRYIQTCRFANDCGGKLKSYILCQFFPNDHLVLVCDAVFSSEDELAQLLFDSIVDDFKCEPNKSNSPLNVKFSPGILPHDCMRDVLQRLGYVESVAVVEDFGWMLKVLRPFRIYEHEIDSTKTLLENKDIMGGFAFYRTDAF